MRLYFENPVGRLLEHPNDYAVVQYNEGPRDFATLRAFLTHTRHLLRRHNWHRMLADQRHMVPFSVEERDWIGTQWLARSATDGDELFGAILLPGDVFTAHPDLVSDSVRLQEGLRYRLFEQEAAAASWLLEQP